MEVYKNMSASHESGLSDVVSEMKNTTKELEKIARHFVRKDFKEDIDSEKMTRSEV